MNLGIGEVVIILFVALIVFGPTKLPQLGRSAGSALHEFKKGLQSVMEDESTTKDKKDHKQTPIS